MSRDDDLLADLLLRWEELREQGRGATPEELCRDNPHLLPELDRRISALTAMGWVDEAADQDNDGRPDAKLPGAAEAEQEARRLGDRYRIDRLIAEGGSGQVWEGYDEELQRAVAVKVPRAVRSPARPSADFLAEGRRVAKLEHPGIVPVYDVGRDGGRYYIVSKLVNGDSVADRLHRRGAFAPFEAARLVADVARSLEYAHRQGFVHRDIKPANILLDADDRPYLTDFGIAVATHELLSANRSGTLSYMSPEQLAGDTRRLDHRTDIYSLGVVLYEMLTGRQPFHDDNPVAVRDAILAGVYRPLREIDPAIPVPLDRIVTKCMSDDPTERYSMAVELADALDNFPRFDAPKNWRKYVRRVLALLFATALSISAATLLSLMWFPTDSQQPPADPVPEGIIPPQPSQEFGGVTEDGKVLLGHTGRVSSLAFGKGTGFLASGGADGTVRLWDTAKADPASGHSILRHPAAVTAVACHPNRAVVAAGCENGRVSLWNTSIPEPTEARVLPGHAAPVTRITFSPDGDMLFSGDATGVVRVHDLTRSPPGVAVLPKEKGTVCEIAAHGDGPRLVVAVADGDGAPAELHPWELGKDGSKRLIHDRGRGGTQTGNWCGGGSRLSGRRDDPGGHRRHGRLLVRPGAVERHRVHRSVRGPLREGTRPRRFGRWPPSFVGRGRQGGSIVASERQGADPHVRRALDGGDGGGDLWRLGRGRIRRGGRQRSALEAARMIIEWSPPLHHGSNAGTMMVGER